MRGSDRIQRAATAIRRLVRPAAVVLNYHRVAEVTNDPYHIVVSPAHFEEHMNVLRASYRPMPLVELIAALRRKSLPRRAVAVTFDDGYFDNFSLARPILERVQVPATVFVCTGAIDSPHEFWWDELERVFGFTRLPVHLSVTVANREHAWPTSNGMERRAAFQSLHALMLPVPHAERERVLAQLARWARMDRAQRSSHRSLSREELARFGREGIMDIGAHTVTHPLLAALTPEEQRSEICDSRAWLESVTGRPVRTFAYPYGNPGDYNVESVEAVRSAGFEAAFSTVQGAIESSDDPLQLRRWEVNDWDAMQFAWRLKAAFAA
jgi:peptidoglycan/xylan/chitin deacetylase (PgdA/CDA1 family)